MELADLVKSMVVCVISGSVTRPSTLTIVQKILSRKVQRLQMYEVDPNRTMSMADIEKVLQVGCFMLFSNNKKTFFSSTYIIVESEHTFIQI